MTYGEMYWGIITRIKDEVKIIEETFHQGDMVRLMNLHRNIVKLNEEANGILVKISATAFERVVNEKAKA